MAERSFFLDVFADDFQPKMAAMYRHIDGEDPLMCALIGAAHIDKCLVALLEHFLRHGGKTTLKKHLGLESPSSGVLYSLYARAEFAYLLGLIDSQTLTNIKDIATIRNLFAHSHTPYTFESEDIAKLCRKLTTNEPDLAVECADDEETRQLFDELQNAPRNRFCFVVSDTLIKLAFLPKTLERPKTPYIDGDANDSQHG